MKKIVIILNGRGEVGKDTLCELISKYYAIMNISSITPIKQIAVQCGWAGEKNDHSRKFLSDLKAVLTEYNDYPTKYLLEQYEEFRKNDKEIMFVQIREGKEIDKFKAHIPTPCVTLLITRSSRDIAKWGNISDDEVEAYSYDYEFDNCKALDDAEKNFKCFVDSIFSAAFR